MAAKVRIGVENNAPAWRFQIGAPQDREGVLQLFSFLLAQADELSAKGRQFEFPFAALVRLASTDRPSLEQLEQFCQTRQPQPRWPAAIAASADSEPEESARRENERGMFFLLLRSALDAARDFDVDGAHVCRAIAAVGQTLLSGDMQLRRRNRQIAEGSGDSLRQRMAPTAPGPAFPAVLKAGRELELPSEEEFRRRREQGGSIRLRDLTLWHASYIGPDLADKSENQDATFAANLDIVSGAPGLVFALADGVSTSMGSRAAANSIVRRFCELILQGRNAQGSITAANLVQAARLTQQALDEMAEALLERPDGYIFDTMRGSSLHSKTAVKILENTMHPRSASIPSALSATLIGGVAQPAENAGSHRIDLLRIGDGTVEHIRQDGQDDEIVSIVDTNPEVVAITQAMGAGPHLRAIFEGGEEAIETRTLILAPGESLLLSSDGLARGHRQTVAAKLSELIGEPFWKTAQSAQSEAALQILHKACRSADDLSGKDPEQVLFADNVSLILIRCGT